jgi:cytochrome c oxidase subunit III
MATESMVAHGAETTGELWEGGQSPFKASYGKLMMWYFLLSDAFTFSGFLIAYGALRFSSKFWPAPDVVFAAVPFLHGNDYPLIFVTFMSFALIFSSVTMVRAVQEGHRENKDGVVKWMIATIIGGSIFLGCQAFEWTHLMQEGMTIFTNPFGPNGLVHMHDGQFPEGSLMGPQAFGALFFFITGFHGFHVFSGVVFLVIIAINAASGLYVARKNGYEMVEKIGLYWHFVDLVWVFVFLVFYLL